MRTVILLSGIMIAEAINGTVSNHQPMPDSIVWFLSIVLGIAVFMDVISFLREMSK